MTDGTSEFFGKCADERDGERGEDAFHDVDLLSPPRTSARAQI